MDRFSFSNEIDSFGFSVNSIRTRSGDVNHTMSYHFPEDAPGRLQTDKSFRFALLTRARI